MKQKNNYLLCKPVLQYSYHENLDDPRNIFHSFMLPDLQQKRLQNVQDAKDLVKRTIVGKPEQFARIAKLREHQLRFIHDNDSFLVPRKFIKQRINDSMSISSQRTRNMSDHKEKSESTNTNNGNITFDVVEQVNLISQMKKIGEQIKINSQLNNEIQMKLSVQDKIIEKKNEKAFEAYEKFADQWEEFNHKLKNKLQKRKNQDSLLNQQQYYSHKIETLNMLSQIQNVLTDDEEEQRKRLNPLAQMFQKERKVLRLESEPCTLKNQVQKLITKEKLFSIPNPILLQSKILGSEPISRKRCQSEFEKLNLTGASCFEKEYDCIKQTAERQNQRYKLFKQKQLDKSCHV